MKTLRRLRYLLAMTGCVVAFPGLVGCQEAPSQISPDSIAQSLVPFVGDFARRVLAAYLF